METRRLTDIDLPLDLQLLLHAGYQILRTGCNNNKTIEALEVKTKHTVITFSNQILSKCVSNIMYRLTTVPITSFELYNEFFCLRFASISLVFQKFSSLIRNEKNEICKTKMKLVYKFQYKIFRTLFKSNQSHCCISPTFLGRSYVHYGVNCSGQSIME